MKWLMAGIGACALAFAGLFAVVEGRIAGGDPQDAGDARPPAESGEAAPGTQDEVAEARAVPPDARPAPAPGFESRIESEVLAPLRERRERSLLSRFSRRAVSPDSILHDLTRVEVPARLRGVADAVIAIELGGMTRLLPLRHEGPEHALEVRIGAEWHPAREWLASARGELAAAELAVEGEMLPRIRRSGPSFEADVRVQLIEPLEERRKETYEGALSRVAPSSTNPFDFAQLDEAPAEWASRSDGAVEIDSWGDAPPVVVPFRQQSEGGALEVHVDGRWRPAREWARAVGASEARIVER